MLRERCNPNPDGNIEGGPKPTEKIIIKYVISTFSNLSDSGSRGVYRFTKMTFLHVLLQIPLLWSIIRHFI